MRLRLGFIAMTPLILGGSHRDVHPMHTTFTEVSQPAIPGIVVITIRGFEDDLASAARVATPSGPVDSAIALYLKRRTALTDRSGRRIILDFTGVRRSANVVWIGFRSSSPVDLTGSRFLNAALTERFEDQVNLVQVKTRRQTRTLLFTPGDRAKLID